MRIGVLGSGVVGQTLGTGLAALGHEVMMGTREPTGEKVRAWVAKAGGKASAGTFSEAASFAELECARYLEPLAMLWVVYGFRSGGWNHAFKLLRK